MGQNLRVFVVEGDSDSLNNLAQILRQAGYDVTAMQRGMKALEIAEDQKPDMMLIGESLQDTGVAAFCENLNRNPYLSDCSILLMSRTYPLPHGRSDGREEPLDGVISPSASSAELLSRVRSMLRVKL